MLAHALNNAVAVALARDALAPLSRAVDSHPHAVGAGALAVCAAGAIVLFRSTSRVRALPRS
jgi:hypothetical protein